MSSCGLPTLSDCVAVVTGASSGIGEAIAQHLSQNGASVVLAARRKDKLDTLCERLRREGGKVLAVPTDVTNIDDVKSLVAKANEHFAGHIDILVNCAGTSSFPFTCCNCS